MSDRVGPPERRGVCYGKRDIGIDFYLIARLVLEQRNVAAILSRLLVALFGMCWFVWPRVAAR